MKAYMKKPVPKQMKPEENTLWIIENPATVGDGETVYVLVKSQGKPSRWLAANVGKPSGRDNDSWWIDWRDTPEEAVKGLKYFYGEVTLSNDPGAADE